MLCTQGAVHGAAETKVCNTATLAPGGGSAWFCNFNRAYPVEILSVDLTAVRPTRGGTCAPCVSLSSAARPAPISPPLRRASWLCHVSERRFVLAAVRRGDENGPCPPPLCTVPYQGKAGDALKTGAGRRCSRRSTFRRSNGRDPFL
eukprot:TRINITY_DN10239_c0_g1_i1.p2 TRINITY_DN10239_c0_g1~~TRINITY_DN10239_c0_g1_i1.p2  ORF type:complete len:147 (+),score=2.40 TRINITY_DN10239_c0_g1_i1:78-518(+)